MIIESLGVYLPKCLMTTADILRGCRLVPVAPFQRLTGIERRPVVGPEEYSIDLARRAIDRCLRHSRCSADAIDLVICCNISRCDGPNQRMSIEPTTAARLCAEFGFSSADAFDVSNACAGTFTGLYLAEIAFAAGAAQRALVVSGEHITHLATTARREIRSPADPRMACLTLGDSGVALLVEHDTSSRAGFQALELFTLGQYSGLCVGSLTDRPHGGAIMLTQSSRLTEAALEHCVPHAPATLVEHDWDPDRVDVFITHQTAKLALDKARAQLNRQLRRTWLRDDNFVSNVRDRGNLATNSHWVALYDRASQGQLQNDQRVVFSIAASGLTGGTALYALDDLPERLRQKPNGYAPPSGKVSQANVWRPKQAVRIAGIGFCDPAATSTGVVEMATSAVRDCLRRAEVSPRDVDILIYCGVYRERLLSEPAVAAMVAGELGIGQSCEAGFGNSFSFDVADGAVGFIKACQSAAQTIAAGRARRALVVAAESPGDPSISFSGTVPIASTASAALLEYGNGDADGFRTFFFKSVHAALPLRSSYCQHTDGAPHVFLEQDEVYAQAADRGLAESIRQLCSADRTPVDWCLLLGKPGPELKVSFEQLGISPDRVISPPDSGGELFTSSFAHGWRVLERSPDCTPGTRVLIVQAGSGMRIAAATYRWGKRG